MKKCNQCGTIVSDDEKICNNCGGEAFDAAPDFNTAPELNGANGGNKPVGGTILQKLSKVLMVISCIAGGLLILPLAWLIPITVAYCKKVKSGKKVGIGFKICVLLFVNVFAGVSMLCDSSDKSDAPVTKATENADLRKAAKILMVISTVIGGFAILPLAWSIPMTIAYFKKVKEGRKAGLCFKICSLLFVNIFAGVYMLCDDAADLNGDEKCADATENAGSAEGVPNKQAVVSGTILQKTSKALMGVSCIYSILFALLQLCYFAVLLLYSKLVKLNYILSAIFTLLQLFLIIVYFKKVKSGKKVGIGFKICVLLFVNVFAGVSMLCDSSDKSDAPVTKATENADLRKATKILMVISTVIGGFAILPLAWSIPMTIAYFKKVKEGRKAGLCFKICSLLFVNIFAGVYMLCDDATDLIDENVSESSDAYFFKAENDDMAEPAKAGVAVAFAEEESEEAKAQKRLEAEQKIATKALLFNKIGSILLAAAAVMALVFTVFIGQTVRYIGQVRNADSVSFSYFTDKNLLDYFTVMDDAAIRQMIADKGVYVTEELVNAYRAISVTETVVAIIMTVAVCAFFVLAVLDFIKNLKDGFQKPRMFGAISTVVTYICGAFIFKAINSGELSVIYKIKNRVESTFRMSLGFNTATIIGLVLTLVAVVVALLALLLPDIWRVKKSEIKIKRKADKMRKFAPIAEKIFAGAVAVCALVCVVFASVSTVTMNSKGTAAVYNKNESTGEYELIDYNSEKGDSLTLISLIQKYSLQEEEILYNIEICQSKIRENDTDIDMKIQLENYRTELADTQKLIADALNFGLTTMYVDIALIVFAGALICFVLCGRRIQKGDLLVVIAVASAIFALLGCMIVIFVMTSFSRLEVQVTGIAPFFHLLFSIAALVGCFYARKFLQYNIDNEKGDQKDVAV